MNRKIVLLVVWVLLSLVLGAGAVFLATWLWPQAGGSATCISSHCFCEMVRKGLVKQPINTVSSLAFVAAAVYAWLRLWWLRSSRVFQGFVVSMVIIGLGSAYYHATLSFAGQWLDVLGMYFFATLMICTSLQRANIVSKKLAITLFVVINVSLGAIQNMLPDTRRWLFAVLIIIALALEFILLKRNKTRRQLYQSLTLMIVAYAIWFLDQSQIVCLPTSLMQGHALWHVLGSLAAYFVVLHYCHQAVPKRK